MTRDEKLDALLKHLHNLIEGAKKRTPGKWIHDKSRGSVGDVCTTDLDAVAQCQERSEISRRFGTTHRQYQNIQRDNNAAYIASCAGNAEAGWRATIAAIDGLRDLDKWCRTWTDDNGCAGAVIQSVSAQLDSILTAWEGLYEMGAINEMKAAVLASCQNHNAIAKEVDGFYYFIPSDKMGIMCPASMRIIADHIDKLNREWNEKIERDL